MIYTFTGEGSCDALYEGASIEIPDSSISRDDVQEWLDKWKETLPDGKLDSFGNIEPMETRIDEVVDAMPKEWSARITGDAASILFI